MCYNVLQCAYNDSSSTRLTGRAASQVSFCVSLIEIYNEVGDLYYNVLYIEY
jgi:hypothetical protein